MMGFLRSRSEEKRERRSDMYLHGRQRGLRDGHTVSQKIRSDTDNGSPRARTGSIFSRAPMAAPTRNQRIVSQAQVSSFELLHLRGFTNELVRDRHFRLRGWFERTH